MSQKKNSIGITGGIGSGKTYICHLLEQRGIPVFYTDYEAKQEMLENRQLQKKLSDLTGSPIILSDGTLNKALLSAYIAQGEQYARHVDALVHPATRRRMRQWLKAQTCPVVAVECALLFESGYNEDVDYAIAVTAPEEVKIARVINRDGHSREHVLRIMALQMTDAERAAKADGVIVNDGMQPLEPQIDHLLHSITSK